MKNAPACRVPHIFGCLSSLRGGNSGSTRQSKIFRKESWIASAFARHDEAPQAIWFFKAAFLTSAFPCASKRLKCAPDMPDFLPARSASLEGLPRRHAGAAGTQILRYAAPLAGRRPASFMRARCIVVDEVTVEGFLHPSMILNQVRRPSSRRCSSSKVRWKRSMIPLVCGCFTRVVR